MPIFNPVPVFSFQVFMFNTDPLNGPGGPVAGVIGVLVDLVKPLLLRTSNVEGLNPAIDIEEYHEGGDNTRTLKFKTWGTYENLKIKRGVTFSPDLWDWHYQVLYGSKPLRKSGIVILNDPSLRALSNQDLASFDQASSQVGVSAQDVPFVGSTPVAIWYFRNGLPAKLNGPLLDANPPQDDPGNPNHIAFEELEISHEGLYRLGINWGGFLSDFTAAGGI